MVIIFNKKSGDISMTIEHEYEVSPKNLNDNEDVLISNNEEIKAHTHKVDVENNRAIKKTKQERENELKKRREKANEVRKKRNIVRQEKQNRIETLEERITELEAKSDEKI